MKVIGIYKGENVCNLLRNAMKLWKIEVALYGVALGCVNIRKDIY